jgi:hypothetical protein
MSGFLFLIILGCAGLIIVWYVKDQSTRGGKGDSGLLGMKSRLTEEPKPSAEPSWKTSGAKKPWRVRTR